MDLSFCKSNTASELHRCLNLWLQFSRSGQRCQLPVPVSALLAGYATLPEIMPVTNPWFFTFRFYHSLACTLNCIALANYRSKKFCACPGKTPRYCRTISACSHLRISVVYVKSRVYLRYSNVYFAIDDFYHQSAFSDSFVR